MLTRLGLCSAYSFLYGVHKHEKLLDRAVSYGVKTVSICDLNNLYGVHSFLEAAKERNIRPIIGSALTVKEKSTPHSPSLIPNFIYCFVENRQGFSRLCELLTLRNKDKENFDPIPFLCEQSSGLVLASADEKVLAILNGRVRRLYAAITPTDMGAVSYGKKLNIPLAFLDNSVFLEKDDYPVHRVLCAIRLLKTIGNLGIEDTANPKRCLTPGTSSWPEAAKGTEEIAALCTYNDLFNGWIFPNYVPDTFSVSGTSSLVKVNT